MEFPLCTLDIMALFAVSFPSIRVMNFYLFVLCSVCVHFLDFYTVLCCLLLDAVCGLAYTQIEWLQELL
jgi:hypothetical protein